MPWPLMASIAYLGGYGMGLFFGMFTNAVNNLINILYINKSKIIL
jgi:hypothetical protein